METLKSLQLSYSILGHDNSFPLSKANLIPFLFSVFQNNTTNNIPPSPTCAMIPSTSEAEIEMDI